MTNQISHNGESNDKVRIKKAVELFGVSESFLRHSIMDRKISGFKLGGAVFVSISEIENQILNNKIK